MQSERIEIHKANLAQSIKNKRVQDNSRLIASVDVNIDRTMKETQQIDKEEIRNQRHSLKRKNLNSGSSVLQSNSVPPSASD